MRKSANTVLAIESAIAGGSLSLIKDGEEVASWIGSAGVSRAEDLLANIDEMLRNAGISLSDLNSIAVSAGPGSFTGIRIGIATAMGLKRALGIPMTSGSALRAMAIAQPLSGTTVAAIPMGRDAVCLEKFVADGIVPVSSGAPETVSESELIALVRNSTAIRYVLHGSLFEKAGHSERVENFGLNVAFALGTMCRVSNDAVAPLFVSKSF